MSVHRSPDDHLLELAHRVLAGEAIDWDKEQVAESEVREGMKRLQHLLDGQEPRAQTETETPPPRERTSRFIGDFRLVRKLGEGGMGVVYEAEQQHPKRPVALKVIRGGANVSADTLKLFRREIQTLARLNHSGIAQLYEAGATDDGMHFFAMELVRGMPLADWLRSRPKGALTPAELKLRLGIFRKICDAVAYAHQKGVVHRDLKPGNVLIPKQTAGSSMQDAVPDVKILDFGLARITDSDVQATTFVTEMGRVQGTLPYMSPEQVRGNPDEIDLRTDVYSLGVMLYEMVTGHLPYDISKAQLPEAVRIICDEPPRSLASTFAGRRRLDADVITIATKCLEKEPARRYQSATALSEDVQRWLTDQPILARRPSAAYQFRKLVLRHKLLFAFAGAVFVLLAGFAVTMAAEARRTARERDRANREAAAAKQVSDFLVKMFEVPDPIDARGATMTAREILEKGSESIQRELKNQPLVQARVMETMGTVYQRLGLPEKSESLLRQVVEIRRRELGEDSPDYARSLNSLGWSLNNHSSYFFSGDRAAEARPLHEEALRILEKAYGPDHADVGWSCYYLAHVVSDGKGLLERARAIFEKDPAQNWLGLSWCLQALANHAGSTGRLSEAVLLMQRVVSIKEQHLQPDSYDLAPALGNLGFWLEQAGRVKEEVPLAKRALSICQKQLPADHPMVFMALNNLGSALTLVGEYDEARPYLLHALDIAERAQHGPTKRWIALAEVLDSLATLEQGRGKYQEAEAFYKRAIEVCDRERPDDHGALQKFLSHYASLLRQLNRSSEAAVYENRAKAIRQQQTASKKGEPK